MECDEYIVELSGELVPHIGDVSINYALRGGTATEIQLDGIYSLARVFFARVRIFHPHTAGQVVFDGIAITGAWSEAADARWTKLSCRDWGFFLSSRLLAGEFFGNAPSVLLLILQAGEYPFSGEVDSTFVFSGVRLQVDGMTISEALDLMCGQLPYSDWKVSPTGGIVQIINRNPETASHTPVMIPIPICLTNTMDVFDASFGIGETQANTVTVFGKNAAFYDDRGSMIRETAFDIIANSSNRTFPLVQDTTEVLGVEIVEAEPPPSEGDFSLGIAPASRKTAASTGEFTQFTITVTPIDGFTGSVTLSATDCTFSPNPVLGGSGTSTMSVNTTGWDAGSYEITVTGTSGPLTHNVTCTVQVIADALVIYYSDGEDTWNVLRGPYEVPFLHHYLFDPDVTCSGPIDVVIEAHGESIVGTAFNQVGFSYHGTTNANPADFGMNFAGRENAMNGGVRIEGYVVIRADSTGIGVGNELVTCQFDWDYFASLLGEAHQSRRTGRITRYRRVYRWNGSSFVLEESTVTGSDEWDEFYP